MVATLDFHLKPPTDCSEKELADFHAFLLRNGEIDSPALPERLRKAAWLAHIVENGNTVASGALKAPKAEHCAAVFRKAGASHAAEKFGWELGWLNGEAQAVAEIISTLIEKAEGKPLFAVLCTDEILMKQALLDQGFATEGEPYASPRGDYSNQLFVRLGSN